MLWHKTKSGVLVNLDAVRIIYVYEAKAHTEDGFFLFCDTLVAAEGARSECEAELAAIEEKIRAATEPRWRMN